MLDPRTRTALSKAIHSNGAAQVRRVRYGVYEVPSASEAGTVYTVTGTAMDGSDHRCTCKAGQAGRPCWHVAAVRLARVQHEARRQARKLAEAPAPVVSVVSVPPAPQQRSVKRVALV